MADNNLAAGATTTRRRRSTTAAAETRSKKATTGRKASTRGRGRGLDAGLGIASSVPTASAGAGVTGDTNMRDHMLSLAPKFAAGIAPTLQSLGYSRAQVVTAFQNGLPNW